MFCKKGVLGSFTKFTGKHLCQSLFLNKIAGLRPATIKKEALAQVFSCEFCEISYRTPLVAVSVVETSKNTIRAYPIDKPMTYLENVPRV